MFKWLSNWFIKLLKHQTYVQRKPNDAEKCQEVDVKGKMNINIYFIP